MDQPITRAEHISIHALREEGDPFSAVRFWLQKVFLSTPSARRATNYESTWRDGIFISIHALREEGDDVPAVCPSIFTISIHALREEGDPTIQCTGCVASISIHALREEGDTLTLKARLLKIISIHALREEGDGFSSMYLSIASYFYPRPPRGGRPQAPQEADHE